MLDFLVTCETRRRLLLLLWAEGVEGSITDIARRSGVSYTRAWHELHAMRALDLVSTEQRGASLVFRANLSHPQSKALTLLVYGGNLTVARSSSTQTWKES